MEMLKLRSFESVWMFADAATDDCWATVAHLKQQKLGSAGKALDFSF